MDKLNLLKMFVNVAEQGSFAATANHLGLSPSTLSKAVARLEKDLRLVLFYRTTRQLTLTESGQAYLGVARKLITDLDQCEQRLSQDNDIPQGVIKLNTPVSYGSLYITPLIGKFHEQYPDITFEISYQDAYVDMISEGIDICIRSGTLSDSGLIAKQLSIMDFLICASPQYIQKHGKPSSIDELDQHPWIRFRYRQTGKLHPIFVADNGIESALNPGQHWIVDDGEALVKLCSQGVGLTQIPHFIAKKAIECGDIVPVMPCYRSQLFGIWAIYPERQYLPAKIRVFIEFLQKEIYAMGETPFTTWAEAYR
ncbi:MAG: LysR family transcriptional regulator [Neptuniibacter sp.]